MADLISRKAAIDALGGNVIVTSKESAQSVMDYIRGCADRIRSLPSARPERKTGKWIHDGCNFKGGVDWMHCSKCGHQDMWAATTRTPFCGWCGARMVQEGEDK